MKRDQYVQFMTAMNQGPLRRVFYKDERYIHKDYQRHGDSLFDPNDEHYLEVRAMRKGRLYYLIALIIAEDKSGLDISDQEWLAFAKACLLSETYDVFGSGNKQKVDYHGIFDTDYFVKWMENMLDTLSDMGI